MRKAIKNVKIERFIMMGTFCLMALISLIYKFVQYSPSYINEKGNSYDPALFGKCNLIISLVYRVSFILLELYLCTLVVHELRFFISKKHHILVMNEQTFSLKQNCIVAWCYFLIVLTSSARIARDLIFIYYYINADYLSPMKSYLDYEKYIAFPIIDLADGLTLLYMFYC